MESGLTAFWRRSRESGSLFSWRGRGLECLSVVVSGPAAFRRNQRISRPSSRRRTQFFICSFFRGQVTDEAVSRSAAPPTAASARPPPDRQEERRERQRSAQKAPRPQGAHSAGKRATLEPPTHYSVALPHTPAIITEWTRRQRRLRGAKPVQDWGSRARCGLARRCECHPMLSIYVD